MSPFKTAQAAVNKANSLNQQPIGVGIIVSAGAYREFVNLNRLKTKSAPLALDSAVVMGSEAFAVRLAAGGKHAHGWNSISPASGFAAGRRTSPAPIAPRTEIVFAGDADNRGSADDRNSPFEVGGSRANHTAVYIDADDL